MNSQPFQSNESHQMKKVLLENEEAQRKLSKRLGCTPIELLKMLKQKDRLPAEIYAKLNEERRCLEARIDEKIKEACTVSQRKQHPSSNSVNGHWIFLQ